VRIIDNATRTGKNSNAKNACELDTSQKSTWQTALNGAVMDRPINAKKTIPHQDLPLPRLRIITSQTLDTLNVSESTVTRMSTQPSLAVHDEAPGATHGRGSNEVHHSACLR